MTLHLDLCTYGTNVKRTVLTFTLLASESSSPTLTIKSDTRLAVSSGVLSEYCPDSTRTVPRQYFDSTPTVSDSTRQPGLSASYHRHEETYAPMAHPTRIIAQKRYKWFSPRDRRVGAVHDAAGYRRRPRHYSADRYRHSVGPTECRYRESEQCRGRRRYPAASFCQPDSPPNTSPTCPR